MENTLTPPVFYLLIAWGIVTAVFVVLLVWRSVLSSHEDDQIFLDAAEEHMAREQRELVARMRAVLRRRGEPDEPKSIWRGSSVS